MLEAHLVYTGGIRTSLRVSIASWVLHTAWGWHFSDGMKPPRQMVKSTRDILLWNLPSPTSIY